MLFEEISMPTISVIVPVYNTEKYLRRCIDSVLAQTYKDFELLLIDDGSKDSSGAICDEYAENDARVRVFHKENGGVSSARNMGLDHARGEWITFVDSDDWIDRTMYEEMHTSLLEEHADIVYCNMDMIFADHHKVYKVADFSSEKKVFLNNFINSWTSLCIMVIKKDLFDNYNIRCPEGVAFAEDYHVSVRLMYYANKISYVDKPLYCYNRVNETSALHTFSPIHYDKERWVNLEVIRFFENNGVYEDYAKSLCWRLLKSIQDYVLDRKTYNRFLCVHPDSHKYIWGCPYLNLKIKIMMWSLSHNLRSIAECMLKVRDLRLKYFSA